MIPHKEWIDRVERLPHPSESRLHYLRLDKNENTIPIPEEIVKKIREGITGDWMIAYPELHTLYDRIADWIGVDPQCIFISQGSDGVIRNTFEIFLKPGDRLLLLDPSYAMYDVYAKLAGAEIETVSFGDSFTMPVEKVLEAIHERTRVICIPNPNNPTGSVFSPLEMTEVFKKAQKFSALVLVDEAYFLYHPNSLAVPSVDYPNVVVARSFSKAFGLAAARIGFGVANPALSGLFHKTRPVYEVNSFAALCTLSILDHEMKLKEAVAKCLEGKSYLSQELSSLGFKTYPSHTNFLLIDVGSHERADKLTARLKKMGILIKGPFRENLLKDCIRVTIGPQTIMDRFLTKFKEAIKTL